MRNKFQKTLLAGLICGVLATAGINSSVGQTPQRPNILFICVDDMNDMIGSYDGPALTPNIDNLANSGICFTNAHCPGVFCAPSRTAILTGQNLARTGFYKENEISFVLRPDLVSFPRAFRNAGYVVAGTGKVYHHMPGNLDIDAFDEYYVYNEEAKINGWKTSTCWHTSEPLPSEPHPLAIVTKRPLWDLYRVPDEREEQMGDTRNANWAAEWVSIKHDKPFFLAFGTYAPHKPNYVPEKYWNMYDADNIDKPAGYKEGDLEDVPIRNSPVMTNVYGPLHRTIVNNGLWKEAIHGYLAAVSYADAMVGRVLDALINGPNSKNTVVVFWSDNGYALGEKTRWGKHSLWKRTTGIPFIWAGRGIPNGISYDGAVGLIDIFPTLLDLTGVSVPDSQAVDGESLVPIFQNPQKVLNRIVFTSAGPDEWSASSNRWRYISNGENYGNELYYIQNDPHEWINLLFDPASTSRYASVVDELSRDYPKNPAPVSEPFKNQYRLVTEGESFKWIKRKKDN
jgi:arylsulfatase A-like enzyme